MKYFKIVLILLLIPLSIFCGFMSKMSKIIARDNKELEDTAYDTDF